MRLLRLPIKVRISDGRSTYRKQSGAITISAPFMPSFPSQRSASYLHKGKILIYIVCLPAAPLGYQKTVEIHNMISIFRK